MTGFGKCLISQFGRILAQLGLGLKKHNFENDIQERGLRRHRLPRVLGRSLSPLRPRQLGRRLDRGRRLRNQGDL